jgi:hypothetical protein
MWVPDGWMPGLVVNFAFVKVNESPIL